MQIQPSRASQICQLVSQLSAVCSTIQPAERYSLFPIRDEATYSYFNRHVATVWTNTEMNFHDDREDFDQLPPVQQRMVSLILAFFSSADGVILNNLAFRFILEAETLEERAFYIVQQFMELIHSEGYSLAINSMIGDIDKRNELFEAANNHPSIIRKNEFMEKYLLSDIERPYRLVAFACAEGIFFISAFLFVFWFRSKGKLPNFIFLNEQVSKDETLHRDFACHLYRKTRGSSIEEAKVLEIVQEAVDIEVDFVNEVLREEADDLTREQSKSYIYRLANSLLYNLGHSSNYEEGDLPSWMNDLAMQQKSNLYEVDGGNYRSRGVNNQETQNVSADYDDCTDF
ncbi:ribonucleoside-diphosphate reductase small chain [Pithovirus sibericum]|uniref:ribonucleoside-diphosphate reductase n=1 Tax=Pithovirus sibericum TaxID=1450746 RepID=W5S6P8_9VIRU|nr:ribonucleoside-diphosphate reductase small chain [Pithovirus sibericum]AHH02007.1 ribonucleoside-diphosphate reductase small chain [Pithovirus sibericum]